MGKASRPRRGAKRARPAASGRRTIGAPTRPTTPAKTYTSKPVSVEFAGPSHRFQWADLEILGIDHSEASYEGRVFLNNPKADAKTPRTIDHGYAGSFYIFGHGGCFGDVGHCEVNGHRDAYDFRDSHPLVPTRARVPVTDTLRQLAKTSSEVTITVVPVVTGATELCNTTDVFRFERMRFLTYNP